MVKIEDTICKLKEIVRDPNCSRMNMSTVKGYLGELFVLDKLQKEGFEVQHLGNQSGYDLEIIDYKIKIDVKFSTLKTDVKLCPKYWGWALVSKNKKKPLSCDYFICVSADNELNPLVYYLIKISDIGAFPKSAIKQFANVLNGFVVLNNTDDLESIIIGDLKEYFSICGNLIESGMVKKINSSEKIGDKLLFKV